MTWVNIENGENALSVRNKINALGADVNTQQEILNVKADLVDGKVPLTQLPGSIKTDSYLAFCANVNSNSLDAAFGKNNESLLWDIGLQLAMYAWFKGDSKVTYPFTNLKTKSTFYECFASAYAEIRANSKLITLISTSPYAQDVSKDYIPFPGDYPINSSSAGLITASTVGVLHTVTVQKGGKYRVKYSCSQYGTIVLKLNGSIINSSASTNHTYSADMLLSVNDILELSATDVAPTGGGVLITTPIRLCTSRSIVLPSSPVVGSRIAAMDMTAFINNEATLKANGPAVVVPKNGTYRILFKALGYYTENTTGSTTCTVYLYKNGSSIYSVGGTSPGTGSPRLVLNGSTDQNLAAGDTLQLYSVSGRTYGYIATCGFTVSCTSTDDFPA